VLHIDELDVCHHVSYDCDPNSQDSGYEELEEEISHLPTAKKAAGEGSGKPWPAAS
jgi:hypothetical protein